MDTLARKRRSAGVGDVEEASGAAEKDYETALGQAEFGANSGGGVSGTLLNGVVGGEASPGTLESGEARAKEIAPQLPSANPFHSERVKAEVELIRNRPTSLDEDARRAVREYDDSALGGPVGTFCQEPDYAAVTGDGAVARDAPRVARVEPSPGEPSPAMGLEDPLGAASDLGGVNVSKGPSGLGLGEQRAGISGRDTGTGEEDGRELIPAEDRFERMEALLLQVMEENRSLKRRLDQQAESRSHSSYHSGLATADQALSPATFGPRLDASVQQFFPMDFPGQGVMMGSGFMGMGSRGNGALPGDPAFWEGTRPEVRNQGSVQRFAPRSLGFDNEGPKAPSLPLPLPPVSVRAQSPEPEPPQTMRQFAESVRAAESLQGPPGFHTPRGCPSVGPAFDSEGYPLSPGGTVIRPPPLPISMAPTTPRSLAGAPGVGNLRGQEMGLRPEEPAKYISELPKLASAELATSAIVCGNWLAQVRQVLVGLSPSAGVWWQGVEGPVNVAYQRWLVADPLGRLAVDPASVKGEYDEYLYGRVESRAVTLLLAAIPSNIRDDVVTNRWLTTTAILFRIFCLFQPGGSNERAHLLAQLVNPEVCKSFGECIKVLRRWNQSLQRASEIHATLPDPSLLLRGVDAATGGLLASNQMVGFRVNSFRHRLGIDYNPTVASVLQLVKLIQAEAEASSITAEGTQDKRARAAAAAAAASATAVAPAREPPPSKSASVVPPPPPPAVNAVSGSATEGKDKGKGKGKGVEGDKPPCHKFTDATGCRFGDSCMFKHDRAKAKKEGRCLACGREGHFRSECSLVPSENRGSGESSPESAKASGPGKGGSARPKGKAKAGAQAKGITEDADLKSQSAGSANATISSASTIPSQEALVAEATKLLKGVALRAIGVGDDPDWSWIRSALASASNPEYCLIDSGATNALRPAEAEELRAGKVIRVDLASGTTELRINEFGTLLHGGQCQVILPASYLVDLGYSISWKRKGCTVKHPKRGKLQVVVVKGCPLIPRDVGLDLLQAYEGKKAGKPLLSKAEVEDLGSSLGIVEVRGWLKDRVQLRAKDGISDVDQLVFLRAMFPGVPLKFLARACVAPLSSENVDWAELPWNRRLRRSIDRAEEGSVLVAVSPFSRTWKGFGRVLSVANSEKGLGCRLVFQALMKWAHSGVIGGLVKGAEGLGGLRDGVCELDEEGLVRMLRFSLVYAVSQAVRDTWSEQGNSCEGSGLTENATLSLSEPSRAGNQELESEEQGSKELGPHQVFGVFEPMVFKLGGETVEVTGPLEKGYGLHEARFDQGCFGAPGVYGTRLVTSSWFLFEAVHEIRADSQTKAALELIQAQEVGFSLAEVGWVSNALQMVQRAWVMWKWEQGRYKEVLERRLILKKLAEEEAYQRHVDHDHVPYRKGCPICIQAQGRQRAHWRSGFPDMHSLSVDLAGPFVSGQSWDVEASGRDRGKGYKYFLACAYAVPEKYMPVVPAEDDTGEYAPSECGELLPVSPNEADTSALDQFQGEDIFGDLWDLPEPGLHAVTHRVKGKRPESGTGELGPEAESSSASGVVPGGDPTSGGPVKGHRTLFFGVPLRTKRGKEVFPSIQGVINRLEAAGFPVQRFHADRAKELRTTALTSWLKHQGIHPTWTAGESPAGNRAELAVQNLKGFVRKLLCIADLSKSYWPLALHHASTRNWFDFCEVAGVVHPPLLPFGLRVHARKRVKTGFAAQWEARTMPGLYLGQAPSTPGGHLVLVEQDGGSKVLLTNTVYPLGTGPVAVKKPKYRLVGKRSPHFSVRVVAAQELPGQLTTAGARSRPGGECFRSSSSFSTEGEFVVVSKDSTEGDFVVIGDDLEGSGSDSDGTDVYLEEEELGSGFFFEVGGVSTNEELGVQSLAALRDPVDCSREEMTSRACLELLETELGNLPVAKRPMLQGNGRAVLLGLYGVGGFRGISKATRLHEHVTRWLNSFVRSQCPDHVWTTLYVSKNTRAPMHRDLRNAKGFDIWVRAVGEFTGGGLWIEGDSNQGCASRSLPNGDLRFGSVMDIQNEGVCFSGERWHASEDWQGESRWVISAFTPRDVGMVEDQHWSLLSDLGFPVEGVRDRLSRVGTPRAARQLVEEVAAGPLEVSWEVGIPLPVVDEEVLRGFDHFHQATSKLSRLLLEDLCESVDAVAGVPGLAGQLRRAERTCDWLEQCLRAARDVESVALRSLLREVPLSSEGAPQDQFLQTRTVGLAEARKELAKWKDPALEEVKSLEDVNRAVERITIKDIDKWSAEGINVVQLPGKVVLTRKSGTGKRRCRAVCCGNYLPTERLGLTREDLYASGAESLSVKVALIFAAGHPSWTGVTIDVKSAFLYAPIRSDSKGVEERIIVKPPSFLLELGIMTRDDRWWIRKALYGLPTSPRDWGRYRDAEFTKFCLRWGKDEYHLVQTLSDDALWLARKVTKSGYGDTEGILVVYVDDLAFLAPRGLGEAFVAAVQERWKTSTPEWFSERPLTFCGMELSQHGHGYRMSQSAYVRELLGRYGIEESASTPITRWTEPEAGSQPSAGEIKEAQAMTGALLWLSTRTRPDLAYVVSRCGQQATKCPSLSVSLGRQALAYLRTTVDMGIEVPHVVGSAFSDHGLLSLPRTERVLELYTDASHSPCGGRSVQGIFLLWQGVPVTWESSRQSFVTLSSAEAELVTMISGLQAAEAVLPLVQELVEQDVTISLLADNEAAIRAFDTAPASWRSRHLRMRAFAARERISANILRVTHLPGQYQIADIATKPLARARILQLLELVNIRSQFRVSESAKNARMLSRISLGGAPEAGVVAQTLAGLALLALLPRVQGQPAEDRLDVNIGWLNWCWRFLVVGVAVVWGWWWFFNLEVWQVVDEALSALGEVLVSEDWQVLSPEGCLTTVEEEPEGGFPDRALAETATGTSEPGAQDQESGDEFTAHEWAIVQAKLQRQERVTGLTFVQRARIRRAVAAGGVVEPPIFQQRVGPLPAWLVGPDISFEIASGVSTQGPGLPEALEHCIGIFIFMLGISAEEWLILRETAPKVLNWVGLRRVRGLRELRPREGSSSHELSNPTDSSAQFGGSHELSNPTDSSAQFGGSPELSNPADSSAQFGGSHELSNPADSSAQFGGSPIDSQGARDESQVGRLPGFLFWPVQSGGSSSSTDPCPVSFPASVGDPGLLPVTDAEDPSLLFPGSGGSIAISSGSHGMASHQGVWGTCYEDLVGIPQETENFPWVGTWYQVHFFVHLLSLVGETCWVCWELGIGLGLF